MIRPCACACRPLLFWSSLLACVAASNRIAFVLGSPLFLACRGRQGHFPGQPRESRYPHRHRWSTV